MSCLSVAGLRVVGLWLRARRRKRTPELGFHVGGRGVAETPIHAFGYVCVADEIWPAQSVRPIDGGAVVVVVGAAGVRLLVAPHECAPPAAGAVKIFPNEGNLRCERS